MSIVRQRAASTEGDMLWDTGEIATLQDEYSVSLTFNVEKISWPIVLAMFGDAQALLWWQFSNWQMCWYADAYGGDDD